MRGFNRGQVRDFCGGAGHIAEGMKEDDQSRLVHIGPFVPHLGIIDRQFRNSGNKDPEQDVAAVDQQKPYRIFLIDPPRTEFSVRQTRQNARN